MTIRYMRQVFFRGLLAVLPIAATAFVAIWIITGFESLFSPLLRSMLSDENYVPGMGVAVGLAFIFAVGLVLQALYARKVWSLGEFILSKTPFVSQLYQAFKQVISYVGGSAQPKANSVVLVDFGITNARMLGLITQENPGLFKNERDNGLIAVFLPWSYQVGGITVVVHKDTVEPVNLTPQEALRFSLTAGVAANGPKDNDRQ